MTFFQKTSCVFFLNIKEMLLRTLKLRTIIMECIWLKVTYRYSGEQEKKLWDRMNTLGFSPRLDMEKMSVSQILTSPALTPIPQQCFCHLSYKILLTASHKSVEAPVLKTLTFFSEELPPSFCPLPARAPTPTPTLKKFCVSIFYLWRPCFYFPRQYLVTLEFVIYIYVNLLMVHLFIF